MLLPTKPRPGDVVRIGDRVRIRAVKRRRGRRVEVVHVVDAPGLVVRLEKRKRR